MTAGALGRVATVSYTVPRTNAKLSNKAFSVAGPSNLELTPFLYQDY